MRSLFINRLTAGWTEKQHISHHQFSIGCLNRLHFNDRPNVGLRVANQHNIAWCDNKANTEQKRLILSKDKFKWNLPTLNLIKIFGEADIFADVACQARVLCSLVYFECNEAFSLGIFSFWCFILSRIADARFLPLHFRIWLCFCICCCSTTILWPIGRDCAYGAKKKIKLSDGLLLPEMDAKG